MKKCYLYSIFLIISLFLFSNNLFALEINVDLSLINNDFFSFKSCVDEYIENNSSYLKYFIFYNNSAMRAEIFRNSGYPLQDNAYFSFSSDNSFTLYNNMTNAQRGILIFNPSNNSCSFSGSDKMNRFTYTSSDYILYSSFSPSITGELIYNYNNNFWNSNDENLDYFLSFYDIYLQVQNTFPSDNTPILTEFYVTVSNKITLFVNYLFNNYIYLSIFVIFILIFVIELIRRYLL